MMICAPYFDFYRTIISRGTPKHLWGRSESYVKPYGSCVLPRSKNHGNTLYPRVIPLMHKSIFFPTSNLIQWTGVQILCVYKKIRLFGHFFVYFGYQGNRT